MGLMDKVSCLSCEDEIVDEQNVKSSWEGKSEAGKWQVQIALQKRHGLSDDMTRWVHALQERQLRKK